MNKSLICFLLALAIQFAGLSRALAQNDGGGIRVDDLKRHVVAIYNEENGKLLGAGTSVGAKGLILTAKHILETKVYGAEKIFATSVQYRTQLDPTLRTAELVAIHPHLDIALLATSRLDTLIQPIGVGSAEGVDGQTPWFVIGHPKGVNAAEPTLYDSKSGLWSEVKKRGGQFALQEGLDGGMSGGPIILGDRLVGVVSYTLSDSSFAVPADLALGFFSLLGFPASDRGFIEHQDHVGELVAKVSRYEEILSDIQADQRWMCKLSVDWSDQNLPSFPSDLDLTVSSQRRLPSQPDLDAKLDLVMDVHLQTIGADNAQIAIEGISGDIRFITQRRRDAEFHKSILPVLENELGQRDIDPIFTRIERLDILLRISGISGEGFINTRNGPMGYSVCCAFEFPVDAAQALSSNELTLQVEASACGPLGGLDGEEARNE